MSKNRCWIGMRAKEKRKCVQLVRDGKIMSLRLATYKKKMTGIHVDMGDIVKIDPVKRTVTLEPMMSMGRLTAKLIPMGWIIPVVPELNDLTIGGLVAGAGIETSSHKYGLIHNICVSYEVVLSNGDVVICTKDDNADLFHAISGSCGTLGFLTAVELMIIPAEKYIKLKYIPAHSLDEAVTLFESKTYQECGNEFVEGIMYGLDKGVIMVGNMTSVAEHGQVNSIGRWYKPWFYKHVEKYLENDASGEFFEYIPLRDYYHRHTKPLFWETGVFIPYGNNKVFRYLFGWILPMRVYIMKLLGPQWIKELYHTNHMAQDFIVPIENLRESIVLSHEEIRVYSLWLCPAKIINTPGAARLLSDADEMYVDIGIYGVTDLEEYDIERSCRRFEKYCIDNRGYQALYSDIYMDREEFAQMFDHTFYNKVRDQLKCTDAFPDVYEKVCRTARK